jgi:hypothetical protein
MLRAVGGLTVDAVRVGFSMASRAKHPRACAGRKHATTKLAELDALAERIAVVKRLLQESLRCGCVEPDACGKVFRSPGSRSTRSAK